ncbi:MAG: DUF4184 family protein [Bacteroidia bacterium]|nr:DUF4184 family protein [Bacteroidia bacterium]
MPFTFSHPAIVLPLKKFPKWFSMTGLIIGSLTPDFEYFIRMSDKSIYSHTLAGIFWYDLPLGILLAFIFHNIVASSFINNLPSAWGSRLSNIKNDNWNNYFKNYFLIVCVSISIGAASHIFWDGFTHRGGYFVRLFPILKTKLYLSGYPVPLFNLFQHLSTIAGGLVVLLFIWKLPPDNNIKSAMRMKYWGPIFVISFIIILVRLLTGSNIDYDDIIMTVISAGLIGSILTPILRINFSKDPVKKMIR